MKGLGSGSVGWYDRVGLGWAAEASSGEDPSFGGVSRIFIEKRR